MAGEHTRFTCTVTENLDPKPLSENLKQLLVKGEEIEAAFKSPFYFVVFTNKRLVAREQNADLSKVVTHTIPYKSLDSFSVTYDKLLGFNHIVEISSCTKTIVVNFKVDVDITLVTKIMNDTVL